MIFKRKNRSILPSGNVSNNNNGSSGSNGSLSFHKQGTGFIKIAGSQSTDSKEGGGIENISTPSSASYNVSTFESKKIDKKEVLDKKPNWDKVSTKVTKREYLQDLILGDNNSRNEILGTKGKNKQTNIDFFKTSATAQIQSMDDFFEPFTSPSAKNEKIPFFDNIYDCKNSALAGKKSNVSFGTPTLLKSNQNKQYKEEGNGENIKLKGVNSSGSPSSVFDVFASEFFTDIETENEDLRLQVQESFDKAVFESSFDFQEGEIIEDDRNSLEDEDSTGSFPYFRQDGGAGLKFQQKSLSKHSLSVSPVTSEEQDDDGFLHDIDLMNGKESPPDDYKQKKTSEVSDFLNTYFDKATVNSAVQNLLVSSNDENYVATREDVNPSSSSIILSSATRSKKSLASFENSNLEFPLDENDSTLGRSSSIQSPSPISLTASATAHTISCDESTCSAETQVTSNTDRKEQVEDNFIFSQDNNNSERNNHPKLYKSKGKHILREPAYQPSSAAANTASDHSLTYSSQTDEKDDPYYFPNSNSKEFRDREDSFTYSVTSHSQNDNNSQDSSIFSGLISSESLRQSLRFFSHDTSNAVNPSEESSCNISQTKKGKYLVHVVSTDSSCSTGNSANNEEVLLLQDNVDDDDDDDTAPSSSIISSNSLREFDCWGNHGLPHDYQDDETEKEMNDEETEKNSKASNDIEQRTFCGASSSICNGDLQSNFEAFTDLLLDKFQLSVV